MIRAQQLAYQMLRIKGEAQMSSPDLRAAFQ